MLAARQSLAAVVVDRVPEKAQPQRIFQVQSEVSPALPSLTPRHQPLQVELPPSALQEQAAAAETHQPPQRHPAAQAASPEAVLEAAVHPSQAEQQAQAEQAEAAS